jgi:hypothetical protein
VRRAAGLCLLALLLAPRAAAAETAPGGDAARVIEADRLLADEAGYPRAIELYRELLAEQPEAGELRLRLARVLAWSRRYDEALAEFDTLLAASPPPPTAAIERAEVLSWAGRLAEAEAAFAERLAADPADARAARGIARVQSWSGRLGEADRSYARALALAPDPEAATEWGALRAKFPASAAAGFDFYEDDDDFQRIGSSLDAGWFWNPDTRLRARLSFTQIEHPREPIPALAGLDDHDRGWGVTLGVARRLRERLEGELDVGVRAWESAGAFALARGALHYTTTSAVVLRGFVEHGDFLLRSDSVAAVEDGIRDTTTGLSAWRAFGTRFEGFAELQNSFLSDSNTRHAVGTTLSFRPWPERALALHLNLAWLGYTRGSDLYYDPDSDFEGTLALTHTLALLEHLELKLRGAFGWGVAQQDGASGNGPGYQIGADLAWRIGRWRLSLVAGRSQSQRESSYIAHRAGATLGVDF